MVLGIDFDGTVVEHDFPRVGKPLPYAFEVLRRLQTRGHVLILWTCREDHPTKIDREYLRHAVEFCRDNGIVFTAVNEAIPDHDFREYSPRRKPHVGCWIDDTNLGGFPGWEFVNNHFDLGPLPPLE